MSSSSTNGHEEIDKVFVRALPLVETALLQEYRLTPQEAAEIEQSLLEWFRGFGRRPGSPQSYEALRRHLLSMTCQAAHVFSSGRLGGLSGDPRLQRALTLGPQQIAIEIEEHLAESKPRDNGSGSHDADAR